MKKESKNMNMDELKKAEAHENQKKSKQKHWNRIEVSLKLDAYTKSKKKSISQRQSAEKIEIPRSTLQHWLSRKASIDAEEDVIEFFESPAGVKFLHRFVVAAHFVITLVGSSGIRLVCLLIELLHLDRFIAGSYGSQHGISVILEKATVEYGQKEKNRLSKTMESKKITIVQDETFHPETCLVAIEPVSNFILLEKYSSGRKAKDWTSAMEHAISSMPVEVIQSTSDEGKGICSHVKNDLGAHHSPDVFHVQSEITKATSAILQSKKRQAEKELEKATAEVNRHRLGKINYANKHGPGRPPDFDKRISKALNHEHKTKKQLETRITHIDRAGGAMRKISEVYHPYDIETGSPKTPEEISSSLNSIFCEIDTIATEAQLPKRCTKRIDKARRVVTDMIATIAFYFFVVRRKIQSLSLSPEIEYAVYHHLIPGIYLSLVSKKTQLAENRTKLLEKSKELLAPLSAQDSPFSKLNKDEISLIKKVALDCAYIFQRSSSCVEGRNGLLSLRHHSLHRISDRKLKALTVVHNYFIKRVDGTTAAERFFDFQPADLFEWLLKQVPLPGRPAKRRSKPRKYSDPLQALCGETMA